MKSKVTFFLMLVALVCMIGTSAQAALSVDENFDGATFFEDQNYSNDYPNWNSAPVGQPQPTVLGVTAVEADPKTTATQGLNVSTSVEEGAEHNKYDAGVKSEIAKIALASSGTLTASTERAYSGTKSLKLTSGQNFSFPRNLAKWPTPSSNHVYQFALAVDPSVSTLPVGTQVGRFFITYATDKDPISVGLGTDGKEVLRYMELDGATTVTFELQFKVNADGNVDVYSNKIGSGETKLGGTIFPVAGSWAMISVLDHIGVADAPVNDKKVASIDNWGAYHFAQNKFVSPTGALKPNTSAADAEKVSTSDSSGVTVYVNSTTPSGYAGIYDIDPSGDWGNNDKPAIKDIDTTNSGTSVINYGIEASNGGVIFVDDFYMSRNGMSKAESMHMEWAMRLSEFDASIGVEGDFEIPAAAKVWSIY